MATVVVEQNVPARMRDGVTLYADVYRPADPGRYPVLLNRTPYGKGAYLGIYAQMMNPLRAAQAGYVAILQDCRGRYASEGEFQYYAREGADGYDAVEWAASLPYSDGNVGMFGLSYPGWTQWAAAMQRPPHLRAIAPVQTWSDLADGVAFRGGAFELGLNLMTRLFVNMDSTRRRQIAAGVPRAEISATVGAIAAAFDRLSRDGYAEVPLRDLESLRPVGLSDLLGDLLDPGPEHLPREFNVAHAEVEVPSLNIGGWYDCLLQGTLDNYTAMRAHGRGPGRQAHLLVGPWAHSAVGGRTTAMGEREFGLAAHGASIDLRADLTATQLRWFDHWLKGADNGVDREPPVRLFAIGEDRWIRQADWPPAEAREQALYLHPGGLLSPSMPDDTPSSGRFTYDPNDPVPTLGGNLLLPGVYAPGVRDQRPLGRRPDVLTFTGAPLDRPLTAMGRVTATLWASSSAPDTDFVVRLLDVHPDGYMENLCDGILRARYRRLRPEPPWLRPEEIYSLRVDLWSIAHRFGAGHRVAVQVTSSSFPRWDRNWNTTDDPAVATAGRPADQTIWHHAAHPSCVSLPLLPGG